MESTHASLGVRDWSHGLERSKRVTLLGGRLRTDTQALFTAALLTRNMAFAMACCKLKLEESGPPAVRRPVQVKTPLLICSRPWLQALESI